MAIKATLAEHKGRRKYQEDRHFHMFHTLGSGFGVFDSHGGSACSQFCADNYPTILAEELNNQTSFQEALRTSLKKIAQQTRHMISGTTASVVFIPTEKPVIYTAVIGDSPIIIRSGDILWVAPEHNIRTNAAEAQSAIDRGGIIFDGYLCLNYGGEGLQMARAFGDCKLDRVLNRTPDIAEVPIEIPGWVLVATDGALDPSHVNETESIKSLVTLIDKGGDAQAVVDRAIAIPTEDNVTAIIVRIGL